MQLPAVPWPSQACGGEALAEHVSVATPRVTALAALHPPALVATLHAQSLFVQMRCAIAQLGSPQLQNPIAQSAGDVQLAPTPSLGAQLMPSTQ